MWCPHCQGSLKDPSKGCPHCQGWDGSLVEPPSIALTLRVGWHHGRALQGLPSLPWLGWSLCPHCCCSRPSSAHHPDLVLLNSCPDHAFVPPRESLRLSQDLGQADSKWRIHGYVTAEFFGRFGLLGDPGCCHWACSAGSGEDTASPYLHTFSSGSLGRFKTVFLELLCSQAQLCPD